ncbi:hypothetical protein PTSG_01114 [Salpingoeca rosetta]|uniref:Uncharacterized protein n=1 Tax=Salpingoeca rosetta (strain ATCC 50818 / BSB-021) TaxID=946362 RepID=F2U0U9_SALR5|nr:uncharacterized protein PTSG_01114 [Salpingoeca rosetta]EGD80523.1 hypothetical protein PTSG_01114 [Salpingoeca rosetta]|eukprot:XP_004997084.1 hypothetical protein PTSG_01114 [Salpingoeca rosetta]
MNVVQQLFSAVEEGNAEKVAFLVKKHRCVDARDAVGATALHHAVSNGKLRVVQALLQAGANVNASADNPQVSFKTGATPLHYAARAGRVPCVRALCRFGADVNAKDDKGVTPLLMAARGGHSDAVIALLDFKAKMLPDDTGITPLHSACGRGSGPTIHALMNAGADPSAKDKYGYSPLFWAARNGRKTAVRTLADHGVTLDFDQDGHTALDIALRFRHAECANLIRKLYPDAQECSAPWSGGDSDTHVPAGTSRGASRRTSSSSLGRSSSDATATATTLPSFLTEEEEEQGYMDVTQPKRQQAVSGAPSASATSNEVQRASAPGASDQASLPRFGEESADAGNDAYIDVEEVSFGFSGKQYVVPAPAPKSKSGDTASAGHGGGGGDMVDAYIDVADEDQGGEAETVAGAAKQGKGKGLSRASRRQSKKEQRRQEKERKKQEKLQRKASKKEARRQEKQQKADKQRQQQQEEEEEEEEESQLKEQQQQPKEQQQQEQQGEPQANSPSSVQETQPALATGTGADAGDVLPRFGSHGQDGEQTEEDGGYIQVEDPPPATQAGKSKHGGPQTHVPSPQQQQQQQQQQQRQESVLPRFNDASDDGEEVAFGFDGSYLAIGD